VLSTVLSILCWSWLPPLPSCLGSSHPQWWSDHFAGVPHTQDQGRPGSQHADNLGRSAGDFWAKKGAGVACFHCRGGCEVHRRRRENRRNSVFLPLTILSTMKRVIHGKVLDQAWSSYLFLAKLQSETNFSQGSCFAQLLAVLGCKVSVLRTTP